jgi:hypothetical protein
METGPLTDIRIQELIDLAATANERLNTTSLVNATHALNLGCSLSLIPGIVVVILVLIFSKLNWVMTALTAVIVVISSLLLANFLSTLARTRTVDRLYQNEIQSEITQSLQTLEVSNDDFIKIAHKSLPANAPLRRCLSLPDQPPQDNE